MRTKSLRLVPLVFALTTLLGLLAGTSARAAASPCAKLGCFTAPFSPFGLFDKEAPKTIQFSMKYPTAASMVFMPDGRIVYWNGLQNFENQHPLGPAVDSGRINPRSKTAVLDLTGTNPIFYYANSAPAGDDLFCADQRLLQNGRVLATGGTHWQTEEPLPTDPKTGPGGLSELYGSKDTHLLTGFGQNARDWKVATRMHEGRWYPTMLTLPSGNQFVAGGVKKLLWNSSLMTQTEDALGNKQYQQAEAPLPENNKTTEIYNIRTNKWTLNPAKDNIEFPLFARLHLLPDGQIFYSGAGQMWGPAGESINQMDWGNLRLFNPLKIGTAGDAGWRSVGQLPVGPVSGAFSVLLPLKPPYTSAQVLVGGGTLGAAPGSYLAMNLSQLITLNKASSGWQVGTAMTGNLNNLRWYSSGVLLPNGQVLAINGADKDEVIVPGTEKAVHQVELYNPATKSWTALASSLRDRTYHNSAMLLPDGSVLVGGHAPINRGYGGTGSPDSYGVTSNNLKDPSFERFFPPYLYAGARPRITSSQADVTWGRSLSIKAGSGGAAISKFVLSRLPSATHITDADARTVELGSFTHHGSNYSVNIPANRSLLPPGFYYLFAMSNKGVPSVATVVQVADTSYFDGRSVAMPIRLGSEPLRKVNPTTSPAVTAIRATGTSGGTTRITSTEPRTLNEQLTGVEQSPRSQKRSAPWVLVIGAVMGVVLARGLIRLRRT